MAREDLQRQLVSVLAKSDWQRSSNTDPGYSPTVSMACQLLK